MERCKAPTPHRPPLHHQSTKWRNGCLMRVDGVDWVDGVRAPGCCCQCGTGSCFACLRSSRPPDSESRRLFLILRRFLPSVCTASALPAAASSRYPSSPCSHRPPHPPFSPLFSLADVDILYLSEARGVSRIFTGLGITPTPFPHVHHLAAHLRPAP
jgi:hypothetical protein